MNRVPEFSLHELACLEAVVSAGGFQAAALRLGRSHPSVHSAVGNLERRLGVQVLDRTQYRVGLTESGRMLIPRIRRILDAALLLEQDAARLRTGEEPELDIVIGDLCPLDATLALVSEFFGNNPQTRVNLRYGAIAGPWEALLEGDVHLIFHHVEPEELRIESLPLFRVRLLPVAAAGFLPFPISTDLEPQQMAEYTQCVLRDSARQWPERNYHVIPGAPRCTVADQHMKKQLIRSGFAWGHMPRFMIEEDLAAGRLVSLAGTHLQEVEIEVRAARRAGREHGPVAQRLWASLQQRANGVAGPTSL